VILCAGLSPAWQKTLVFDDFAVGQVNRAAEVHWSQGGKALNVAVAVRLLGGQPLSLAPGRGPGLVSIDRLFQNQRIARRWIETAADMRICTTILDRRQGRMTELVEEGQPLTENELQAYLDAYAEEAARADAAVITGSLPHGVPTGAYRELLRRTPCPAILDFRGQGLLDTLEFEPLVVKPNRDELAATIGRTLGADETLVSAMRDLNHRGATWVVVTDGSAPVWVTTHDQTFRLMPPPADDIVNPLGSGDALAAAIAVNVTQGRTVLEGVRQGMAAAFDNLRHRLPCSFDASQLGQVVDEIKVEEMA
jgi:1-phosphofructokinase family hexose kinase